MRVPRIQPSVVVVVAALALTGIVSGLTGCTNTGPVPPTTASMATTSTQARRAGESEGAFVFRTQCAGCHGTKGEGNLGPTLVGIADRTSEADEVALVQAGKERMPPFATGLTEAQIRAVVEYTRTQLR